MTLREVIEIIDSQKGIFEADNARVLKNLLEVLKDIPTTAPARDTYEQTHVEPVTQACIRFAEDGTWPVLPPEQQFLVYERLKQAKHFLWTLETYQAAHQDSPIAIDPRAGRPSIISFLLVHYWGLVGRRLWLAEMTRQEPR